MVSTATDVPPVLVAIREQIYTPPAVYTVELSRLFAVESFPNIHCQLSIAWLELPQKKTFAGAQESTTLSENQTSGQLLTTTGSESVICPQESSIVKVTQYVVQAESRLGSYVHNMESGVE